jgi:deazaflavin-dependent oxidoreductase (nitroreductase family)
VVNGLQRRRLLGLIRRVPALLHRTGLGALLPDRLLLLTYTARSTGEARCTVLEVLRHDEATDVYIIGSARGPRADWYQDLLAHPDVTLTVGGRRRTARARPLPLEAGRDELREYARRHRLAFRLRTRLTGPPAVSTFDAYHELARRFPLVALEPTGGHPDAVRRARRSRLRRVTILRSCPSARAERAVRETA